MKSTFSNSRFATLYLWATKAKYTMGIFFAFCVFIYLLLGIVAVPKTVTLDFWTSVEMMFACFFVGVAQQLLLPIDKLSRLRCIGWMLASGGIMLTFSLVFRWFAAFPVWCLLLFTLFFVLGMGAMLVSYYLELHQETRKLNHQLEQFQKGKHHNIPKGGV